MYMCMYNEFIMRAVISAPRLLLVRHTYRKSVLSQVKEFVKPVQFDYCFWFLRATCPDECVETVQCLGDSRWRGYALAAESRK